MAYYICEWFRLEPPLLVVVAAVLTTQPSIYLSVKFFLDQIQANVIGAVLGVIAVAAIGNDPIIIGLVVIVVISVNLLLKLESSISLSIVTVIAVMEQPDFALDRFMLIMIGIVLSIVINAAFLPPKPERQLLAKLQDLHARMLFLLRNMSDGLLEEAALTKEKTDLFAELKKADGFYQTYKEERNVLSKQRRSKAYKLVIYRNMLDVLRQELHLIRTFHPGRASVWNHASKRHILELAQIHETVIMKHEGKIKRNSNLERRNRLSDNASHVLESLWSDAGEQPPAETFVLFGNLLELEKRIYHLDKMITSYVKYHYPK